MTAGTSEGIYCFKILKRANAKDEAKPFKRNYSRGRQCYSKLNFNKAQKMLKLQKVYQRRQHPKDTMPQGTGVDTEK